MVAAKLTQRSRRLTQGFSFALLCEYLGGLCVSIRASRKLRVCLAAAVALSAAVWWSGAQRGFFSLTPTPNIHRASESEIDQVLQQAATDALGKREGTIIVMDPQTGRVRAIVNSQIAIEHSFAPGSTIKPFVALAALRANLIDKDSRTLCRTKYSRRDFEIACAHPIALPSFDPAEALAWSCNYYFGTLGERLGETQLSETLADFGFGKQTGINAERESTGRLLRGKLDPRNALGEGDYLQTTPIQLITAYAALLNGGHLFSPQTGGAADFHQQARGDISIAAEHRAVLVAGMRGAIVFGTAKGAQLDSLPLNVIGKTGTSAPSRGFRSQGWFVGFAFDSTSPENVNLAVLVLLRKGHGAQAAEIAKPIFEQYACLQNSSEKRNAVSTFQEARSSAPSERHIYSYVDSIWRSSSVGAAYAPSTSTQPASVTSLLRSSANTSEQAFYKYSVPTGLNTKTVHVHLVRENITKEMSLEDYVIGVVAVEGSTESEPEALKALAIAARTYALKNLGRHRSAGYDFCTLTHCQRFMDPDSMQLRPAIVAAVRETAGFSLTDEKGETVDAYFSASCGGATANIQTLWGVSAPKYLRGVRDEYCATMPHHSWTDVIPATKLLKALRSDARTDPGATLHNVTIARRDATGRAESINIEGDQRRTISGWDFKIIVGRALGWNVLKSSRFEIKRAGSNFIFRGSGFGHGLGLCQEGAHVMAQRGADCRQILAKYFPGTRVNAAMGRWRDRETGRVGWQADLLPSVSERDLALATSAGLPHSRAVLSSEHFRVSYPVGVSPRDAELILKTLESSRSDLLHRISAAGISIAQFPALEIFINDTTGDFVGRTGQPWWAAAATRGNRIELQPIEVLKRRGVLMTTLRHELAHPLIDEISHGRAPRWLAEGMALYLAGEGQQVLRYASKSRTSVEEIECQLKQARSADQMRAAYAAAYREISELIKERGETSLWLRLAAS